MKNIYLRKVFQHSGKKLWFYSAKDWQNAKFLGEYKSTEEAVKKTNRNYAGLTEAL